MLKVVLASSSPRRRELLKDIFEDFEVASPKAEEKYTCKGWGKIVQELARIKAQSVKELYPRALIIAADTIVVKGRKMLGKPKDALEAAQMLESLSASTHAVYSGMCLLRGGISESFYDKALVTFRKLSRGDIKNYIERAMPLDKAGAYGIQETDFAVKVKGSYSCVIGLPIEMLKDKLKKMAEEKNGEF